MDFIIACACHQPLINRSFVTCEKGLISERALQLALVIPDAPLTTCDQIDCWYSTAEPVSESQTRIV